MDFQSILAKINNNIKHLFSQETIDLDLASKEVEDYLITLESKFSADYQNWIDSNQVLVKYSQLEKKLLNHLKQNKLSYSVVSELNQIYLKDEKNHVVQVVSLINIDKMLEDVLNLKKDHEHFYIIKSLLSKNHRIEVVALSHGLKL
jgi:hypothetical protein